MNADKDKELALRSASHILISSLERISESLSEEFRARLCQLHGRATRNTGGISRSDDTADGIIPSPAAQSPERRQNLILRCALILAVLFIYSHPSHAGNLGSAEHFQTPSSGSAPGAVKSQSSGGGLLHALIDEDQAFKLSLIPTIIGIGVGSGLTVAWMGVHELLLPGVITLGLSVAVGPSIGYFYQKTGIVRGLLGSLGRGALISGGLSLLVVSALTGNEAAAVCGMILPIGALVWAAIDIATVKLTARKANEQRKRKNLDLSVKPSIIPHGKSTILGFSISGTF